jgi:hypothetical protein
MKHTAEQIQLPCDVQSCRAYNTGVDMKQYRLIKFECKARFITEKIELYIKQEKAAQNCD